MSSLDFTKLGEQIRSCLEQAGITLEEADLGVCCGGETGVRAKVVCVAPDLKDSVEELGQYQRDQVVMVRVDAETLRDLDAWVATDAVKSRSEAAALFIREGLKVRADELSKLRDALEDVAEARARLRQKAQEIFGGEG